MIKASAEVVRLLTGQTTRRDEENQGRREGDGRWVQPKMPGDGHVDDVPVPLQPVDYTPLNFRAGLRLLNDNLIALGYASAVHRANKVPNWTVRKDILEEAACLLVSATMSSPSAGVHIELVQAG